MKARTHGRPAAVLAAAVALVLVVIGPAGRVSSQTALPVVTASASDGMVTTVGNCAGSSTSELDPASVTVTRTGDTSTDLFVDLAWGGTISFDRPGEGLTIPAGSSSTTFEIDSGASTGTVTIEIGQASNPDAPYEIGNPSTATARVLAIVTDPVCATAVAPSTTTTPPSPGPAPARPIPATADYTG